MAVIVLAGALGALLALAPAALAQEDAGPDEAGGEAVRGTLLNRVEGEREPVEGAEIVVTTADGEEVGDATTDEEGRYEILLPGVGRYIAVIDVGSLPDGVGLTDEEGDTLEFDISPGQSRPLLFPLGESTREVGGDFRRFLQLLVEGIKFGLIIAMASIGLSLIYGTTGLVNFAHGELVTLGGLAAWFFNRTAGLPFILAAVLGILVGAAFAGGLDRGLWRPLRRRGTGLIAMLVITIGLSLLLRYLFLYQFGGRNRPFTVGIQRAIEIGPVAIAPKDLIATILALVTLVIVGIALQRTRVGKAMRAVADNPDLAASSGIDVQRVILYVWVFGGGLAAMGGILFGLGEQVSFQFGFQLLLLMFAGITLGGLGTAFGALIGSFVIGVFTQVSTLWISSELKNVGALLILVLILLVRPQGILGQAERVG